MALDFFRLLLLGSRLVKLFFLRDVAEAPKSSLFLVVLDGPSSCFFEVFSSPWFGDRFKRCFFYGGGFVFFLSSFPAGFSFP